MKAHTGLSQVQVRWDPNTETKKWMQGSISNQEAIDSWYTLVKQKLVFSTKFTLGLFTTLQVRLNAQVWMVNTEQTQWYF